ncbi:zinc-dependent alcohol dehydrogenase family protein [Pollutimonas thiosulfatoxidans]|uniref:NAD(P)-dependent alcohol dehydrogenase n=1 Tax=Pollutimonas thiosulfatoxidans TaxID=2028345 RepID=A0A410GD47_9BURK|nr:NAD(P)-dependent alcohol dehydrogenase [Pollutimonas thiosulfatoxidans]QAA94213.1 NAD(P)-dependent alcohol dehydrogenase [Pollutimonas thiosulfatoxidans]
MKAYELHAAKNGLSLTFNDKRAQPEPGHGEVLIRVHAVSLNFRDLLIADGSYGRGTKANVIPVSDGAGEISAVGPGVTSLRVGDRVVGAFFPDWTAGDITEAAVSSSLGGSVDGMLSQYVVLPERAALKFADHLSYEEAATLPCAALTAWQALVDIGRVNAGQTVLLQGTGGVSIFALQFAQAMGATVIQTSSSNDKLERVRQMGARHTINYRDTPEWSQEVRRLTDGRGVDLVVEVGGAGTLEQSLQAVRVGGTVATIGLVSGVGDINPLPLISRAIRLNGVYVGSHAMFAAMNKAISAHQIKPIMDRAFSFEQAADAYAWLRSGSHFGKVVITIKN